MTRALSLAALVAVAMAITARPLLAQDATAANTPAPNSPAPEADVANPADDAAPADNDGNMFKKLDHWGNSWHLETNGGGEGALWSIDDALILITSKVTAENWHVQCYHPELELKDGTEYTLKFKAKSPESAQMLVVAQLNKEPWTEEGLHEELSLTPEYKDYEFTFKAAGPQGKDNRIGFVIGLTKGIVYVDAPKLTEKK